MGFFCCFYSFPAPFGDRARQIGLAIIGESARWGDFRMDVPDPSESESELNTREKHWLPELEKALDKYIPFSNELALEMYSQEGIICCQQF